MKHTRLSLWLFAGLALSGCEHSHDHEPAAPVPPPPPKPWKADVLKGPFASVAAFCESLGAASCEEREDVVVALPGVRDPKKARDGSPVSLVTAASDDGKLRRAHLLLRRGAEVFALPATGAEIDPKDGRRHEITVRSFELDERSGLVALAFAHEVTSGEGAAARHETHARQAHCRADKDFPIACALFDTEQLVTTGDELAVVAEQTAEVLVKPRDRGLVTLVAHGQSAPEPLKTLSAPGDYVIAFP